MKPRLNLFRHVQDEIKLHGLKGTGGHSGSASSVCSLLLAGLFLYLRDTAFLYFSSAFFSLLVAVAVARALVSTPPK